MSPAARTEGHGGNAGPCRRTYLDRMLWLIKDTGISYTRAAPERSGRECADGSWWVVTREASNVSG